MSDNELFTHQDGTTERLKLRLRQHRPLGWAELETHGTVAGLLGQLGAERLPRRYPIYFSASVRDALNDVLSQLARRSTYFDRAWILLNARTTNAAPAAGFVALLSLAQLCQLPPDMGSATLVLDNDRIIETIGADGALPGGTLEYQGAEYVGDAAFLGPREGELVLVATPSTPYFDRIRTRHSYYCVLNPMHRTRVTTDYVSLRNLFLQQDYPNVHAAIPLRTLFDSRVPAERIVLDSTTLFAIGLPQGEPVGLANCDGTANRIRNILFGSRHTIARVGRTAVIDIEKPVIRLPEEMLDLLGVASGNQVIVEAVSVQSGRSKVARASLRALPWRDRSPLLIARSQTGVPDNQQLVGDEDFPQISLDLATRERLGIVPGSAVYVRPAVSSLLAREFSSVSFILIAAVFSAAALQSAALAIVSASIYVLLAMFVAGVRLR
ncbi:hypothetical protein Dvina_19295 [Dactylosporangium vinaceum]|uniref:Uncharacterized protein n=1 Tax=Dactylosporangium vinaceum TaxID=53362 RepID=A0ABV5M9F4_9ACTN|nr:hypothetical protein [Dactylosporangium vinaceum]UAC00010.1 hypothetical protein Dvina_19295 [Dactylosporangium vinaceum]